MFGRFIAALMNWHNANMNSFAVRQLALDSRDRVLEIGFGGGVTLQPLLKCAAYVVGIDRSRDMVEHAKRRYFDAVQAGRAEFREGNVESIPFASGSFDKVCTVNTIYFWPSLEAAFREILRVLAPGGRLVVGFLPKERMDRMGVPADIFTTRRPDDVVAALTRVGFADVHIERPTPTTAWNIVATR